MSRWPLALAIGLGIMHAGCTQIVGADEFRIVDGDGGMLSRGPWTTLRRERGAHRRRQVRARRGPAGGLRRGVSFDDCIADPDVFVVEGSFSIFACASLCERARKPEFPGTVFVGCPIDWVE